MEFTITFIILILLLGFISYIAWKESLCDKNALKVLLAVGLSILTLFCVVVVIYYNVGHYRATIIDTQTVVEEGDNGSEFEKFYIYISTDKKGYVERYEYIGKDKYDVPQSGDKIDLIYREFYKKYTSPASNNNFKISEINKESN